MFFKRSSSSCRQICKQAWCWKYARCFCLSELLRWMRHLRWCHWHFGTSSPAPLFWIWIDSEERTFLFWFINVRFRQPVPFFSISCAPHWQEPIETLGNFRAVHRLWENVQEHRNVDARLPHRNDYAETKTGFLRSLVSSSHLWLCFCRFGEHGNEGLGAFLSMHILHYWIQRRTAGEYNQKG